MDRFLRLSRKLRIPLRKFHGGFDPVAADFPEIQEALLRLDVAMDRSFPLRRMARNPLPLARGSNPLPPARGSVVVTTESSAAQGVELAAPVGANENAEGRLPCADAHNCGAVLPTGECAGLCAQSPILTPEGAS